MYLIKKYTWQCFDTIGCQACTLELDSLEDDTNWIHILYFKDFYVVNDIFYYGFGFPVISLLCVSIWVFFVMKRRKRDKCPLASKQLFSHYYEWSIRFFQTEHIITRFLRHSLWIMLVYDSIAAMKQEMLPDINGNCIASLPNFIL